MAILFFLAATVVMTGLGWWFLVRPIRRGEHDRVFQGFILALGAKALVGGACLVIALKVLAYSQAVAAIGTVTAYLVALVISTVAAITSLKRGSR